MQPSSIARTADGRDLAFCEWGPPDGSPVFVLHGTPGSRYLRHVGGEYERTGVRAITYDRPGYGRSSRLPGRSVALAAHDVATIADQLGLERFAMVGVSGGGPHALAAAAAMPDRVIRCATIAGAGPHDAEDLDVFDGMNDEELEEWRCAQQGEQCLAGQFYEDSLEWVESLTELTDFSENERDMLVEAFLEALVPGPYGMADDYAALLKPWGFDIADVVCPTKVMIAKEDTSVPPAHGQWLAAHLADADVVWVEGGHLAPREEPEERLLAWLAAADAPVTMDTR
jgi:pimeloyl-ACP methyl ester carboxylesterase